jgi:hypothetical protein
MRRDIRTEVIFLDDALVTGHREGRSASASRP